MRKRSDLVGILLLFSYKIMSINLYQFNSANNVGDKEAVIVPNVPTLVNKLSAAETNKLKDKVNEIIPFVNAAMPTPYLSLELIAKGYSGGSANIGDGLEVGDIVQGFKEEGVFWSAAEYLGGDVNNRDNYQVLAANYEEPQTFTALSTGTNQTFILPPGFQAAEVYKSRGLLYKTTEWEQTADALTILVNANINNTIYVTSE